MDAKSPMYLFIGVRRRYFDIDLEITACGFPELAKSEFTEYKN
jgi:hypothetical protein